MDPTEEIRFGPNIMDEEHLRRLFARNVRRIAESRGMGVKQLSEVVKIASSTFFRTLRCETSATLSTVAALCTALDCRPSDFFLDEDVAVGNTPKNGS